jgi:carbamoyltransferase
MSESSSRRGRKRNYVGLGCSFHDPSLAVVDSSGRVTFAEATERHLQFKRGFQCPPDKIAHFEHVLKTYSESDTDVVLSRSWSYWFDRHMRFAAWWNRNFGRFNLKRRINRELANRDTFRMTALVASTYNSALGARYYVERFGPGRSVTQCDWNHHLCHAATACYSSPFTEAVCAVIDGFGEYTSTAYYRYGDGRITRLPGRQQSWNTLGMYYEFLCHACGFDWDKGEEWKVMGFAPYGHFDEKAYDLLKKAVRVEGLCLVGLADLYRCPLWFDRRGIEPANLAFTGQYVFEERMTEILNNLRKIGVSDNLVLSGGCALNSSYNGLILERTGFANLFVNSAPADDGNAVGAALLSYKRDHPDWRPRVEVHSPFLGSTVGGESLENLIRFDRSGLITHHAGQIHEVAADLLAAGEIIGWVQGRAEFGPRALGNRSILADARDPNIKDRINGRVKFREEFRPFAPSILHEFGPEYFENYQESPYMDRTLRFREAVKAKVPGVVHVNGTGRLQTVKRAWNEKYYDLISAFHRRTGVPLVLNTSFNIMGKPIIHSVEDAIAVLHTTGLDALVIEDYLIRKPSR